MSKKKKNIAEWKSTILWTAIVVFIFSILYLSIQKKGNTAVNKVNIVIKSYTGNKAMITKKEVKKIFRDHLGYGVDRSSLKELNTRKLESVLTADDRVKRAEIYVDKHKVLHVFIAQKDPLVRIMDNDDVSYYIDEMGEPIAKKIGSAVRVPIATGYIEPYKKGLMKSTSKSNLRQIYEVASYIHKDEFLLALIEQIDISKDGNITVVPKIGQQKLVMGNADELEEKFDRLKILYRNGLPQIGWNKHSVYRLDLKDQITGVKMN